jgi:hypothetical protein
MQFINGPLTSASRTMPQWNKVDAITDWSVAEEEHVYQPGHGDPYSFETSTSSGKVTTRWYFPGVRDQTRAFTVRYTLKGALWIDPAGDRFHWTLFEYASPITSTRMLLHLPRRFEVEELKFTTYSNHRLLDGQTIEFAFSGSGSEFDVQFPHGTVTAQPPAWQKAEAQSSNALRLMLIAIVVCGIVTVTAGIWLRRLTQRQGVKPAKLVVAIAVLAPSAVCTAISLPAVAGGTLVSTMSREFLILVFAGWTIPALLVLLIGYGRGGAGAGGWSGGGDFGGGGGYDGGGGGGDSGGSSGFD